MKKILFLISMFGLFVLVSCSKNKQNSSNEEKLDTVWNEKVQDTFYGMKLGDSLDVSTIVSILDAHGFWFVKNYSSEVLLHFKSRQGEYFSFGGLSFEMLDICRNDGIFTGVGFMNSSNDKASSLDKYSGIKNTMDSKYSPTSITSNDTTVYAVTRYYGKNKVRAVVGCFRYESVGKKILIGTQLGYNILRTQESPSEEL